MTAVVLHVEDGWFAFEGGRLTPLPAYPELSAATLVISDFHGASSDVMALDEKPAFAEAVIERRLRREGQVDGECKVLIHQQVAIGEGFQALYTAVPIEQWQRLLNWSRQQSESCLIVPLASLLWRKLANGQGVVLHSRRRLIFSARVQNRLLYATTVVFSDRQQDRLDAVNTLALRVAEQRGSNNKVLSLGWCALQEQAADELEQLTSQFVARCGSGVLVEPVQPGATQHLSQLLGKVSVRDAVNPLPARLAFVAQQALPALAAVSAGLSLLLVLLGGYWWAQAAEADRQAQDYQVRAQQLLASVTQLNAEQVPVAEVEPVRQLVARLHEVQALADPHGELQLIRQAAADVRILRLRSGLEPAGVYLRVEGVAPHGDRQLSGFLQGLRRAGYAVTAIDSADNSQPAGFFSYQLNPIGARP